MKRHHYLSIIPNGRLSFRKNLWFFQFQNSRNPPPRIPHSSIEWQTTFAHSNTGHEIDFSWFERNKGGSKIPDWIRKRVHFSCVWAEVGAEPGTRNVHKCGGGRTRLQGANQRIIINFCTWTDGLTYLLTDCLLAYLLTDWAKSVKANSLHCPLSFSASPSVSGWLRSFLFRPISSQTRKFITDISGLWPRMNKRPLPVGADIYGVHRVHLISTFYRRWHLSMTVQTLF